MSLSTTEQRSSAVRPEGGAIDSELLVLGGFVALAVFFLVFLGKAIYTSEQRDAAIAAECRAAGFQDGRDVNPLGEVCITYTPLGTATGRAAE